MIIRILPNSSGYIVSFAYNSNYECIYIEGDTCAMTDTAVAREIYNNSNIVRYGVDITFKPDILSLEGNHDVNCNTVEDAYCEVLQLLYLTVIGKPPKSKPIEYNPYFFIIMNNYNIIYVKYYSRYYRFTLTLPAYINIDCPNMESVFNKAKKAIGGPITVNVQQLMQNKPIPPAYIDELPLADAYCLLFEMFAVYS